MTDARGPNRNKKINILENIVMRIQDQKFSTCHKNQNNVINSVKRRDTVSSLFFDEEPVFSNSDEENSYRENILAHLNIPNSANNVQKVCSIKDRHILTGDELKVIKVAKECTNVNIDNVNDDFKNLINICNYLQFKYGTPLTPEAPNKCNNSQSDGNKISNIRNSVSPLNILTPGSSPQMLNQEMFAPSRNGETSDSFSEQFYSFENSLKDSPIAESNDIVIIEPKNVLRRSDRIQKPVQRREIGVFIPSKDKRKYLNERKRKAKTQNKVINRKTLSRKSSSQTKSTKTVKELTNFVKENNANFDKLNTKVDTNKHGSISLQHQKSRRIYSPSRWMESEEFKNTCLIERRNFSL